jgi:hypothetical protein
MNALLVSLVLSALGVEALEALAKNGGWVELLERAEEVSPQARDDRWRRVVTQAVTAVVKTSPERARALAERYPFATADADVAAALRQRRASDFAACLRPERPRGDELDWCLERLLSTKPADDSLVAALDVLTRDFRPIAGLPLWVVLASRSNTRCDDPALRQAVLDGLELPAAESRAAQARTLAFTTCWAQLSAPVKAAMVHPSSYLLRNACPALEQRQALTELQRDLCADER